MPFTKEDSAKTKGVAVILLLFHHLFFMDRGYEVNLQFISIDTLRAVATAARICVWIFVFLSAYGITVQFENRPKNVTISAFLQRRWVSLMKGYWFVFALTFVVLFLAGKESMEKYNNSFLNLLLDAFALSDFFGTPTLLGTWWYMCFAQMQLLLMPAVILLCKHLGGVASFAVVFFVVSVASGTIVSPSGGDYLMYTYATLFGVLCVQYRFFENIKVLFGYKAILRWLSVLCIAVLGIYMRSVVVRECQINRVSYGIAAVCVAALIFLMKDTGKKMHKGRALQFLGIHSGNIFMIHMLWVKYFGRYVYASKSVVLTVVTLLAVSVITSLVLERVKKLVKYDQWFNALFRKNM